MSSSVDKNFLLRYSRQICLPGFLLDGQKKLFSAQAAIVGLGGLGCVVATQLAAAGIGKLLLIDDDDVHPSNFPRQWIYSQQDVGQKKVEVAKKWLTRVRDDLVVETKVQKLTAENARKSLAGYGVVIDAVDNPKDKLMMNDFALSEKVSLVYGGAVQYQGAFMSIIPGKTHCLRCCFPRVLDEGQNCSSLGVSSALCSIIGSFQAHEAIALLSGCASPRQGSYHFFDLQHFRLKSLAPSGVCRHQ